MRELRPYQQKIYEFLLAHPYSAVWAESGLGKTYPLCLVAEGKTLVVAPAAVRDTKTWLYESAKVGIEPPRVISYHEVARLQKSGEIQDIELDTLIMDEAHHAIHKTTSWFPGLEYLAKKATRVHQATGTPMPNAPHELWGQFHLLFPKERPFKYFWPWATEFFSVMPNRYNPRAREVSTELMGCNHKGQEAESCEHWQAFHEQNIEGRAIRHKRADVLKDLPPLSGDDQPLWTPMAPVQLQVYKSLKKDLLALIPEEGIAIEALTQASQFIMLHQLSSGLSVLDPEQDPLDKQSGKLAEFAELISVRPRPTLATVWFRNSAQALARVCERQGKSYVFMSSKTTRHQRDRAVQDFSVGLYDVMIASIGVIKEGVDGLQHAADEAILFERSWRPGDNEQTIRRLHRLGQQYPVTARQLVCPQSVDSYQWDVIHTKQRIVNRALRRAEIASLI